MQFMLSRFRRLLAAKVQSRATSSDIRGGRSLKLGASSWTRHCVSYNVSRLSLCNEDKSIEIGYRAEGV
jgi:hypothetical protein